MISDPDLLKNLLAQNNSVKGTTSNPLLTQSKTTNDQQKDLSAVKVDASKNVLHNYTDYTYRLTWYLLTRDEFNSMVLNPGQFIPKHVIMSSGGGRQKERLQDFQEDFYIENLEITTIVGLNAKSRSTNAIDMGFTVVEPYGMTLLDRILSACETVDKCANYAEQPYLLEIDFLTNVDEATGGNQIKGTQKRIPIRLAELKIKPGPGGTEYRIRTTPYNHMAFSESMVSMPINLAVEATTLGDFFGDDVTVDTNNARVESDLTQWKQDRAMLVYLGEAREPSAAEVEAARAEIVAKVGYKSNSLAAGFNEYMRGISGGRAKGNIFNLPPVLISFVLDDEFKNEKIVDPDITITPTMPMIKSDQGINTTVDSFKYGDWKNKQTYSIHHGTAITTIIERVMMASNYIKKQVLIAKEAANVQNQSTTQASQSSDENKFIKWFKIIPEVLLGDFDDSRGAYSKEIRFHIRSFRAANPYHPDFEKTKITKNKVARSYNYLYTGKNEDIVSLDVNFDALYYTQITTFQASKTRGSSSFAGSQTEIEPNKPQRRDTEKDRQTLPPNRFEVVGADTQNAGQVNRNQDPKDHAIASLAKSIYSTIGGDMLSVQARIVGDPGFIKQDDLYYGPSSGEFKANYNLKDSSDAPILPTGQIVFDSEEVFVQLLFKSTVDIDDNLGITNKQIKLSNGRTTDGTFSGIYKVSRVRSEFSKGKFEQILELIRQPDDVVEDNSATSSSNSARV